MQPLEISGAVRPLYGSLGVKRLIAGIISDCILAAAGTPKIDYKLPNYVHDNYCKLRILLFSVV